MVSSIAIEITPIEEAVEAIIEKIQESFPTDDALKKRSASH